jgi:poly(A) polymerase
LRAIRLACQLDFEIEAKTFQAGRKMVLEIKKTFIDSNSQKKERVSDEVIAAEFLKGFSQNPVRLIELCDKIGLLKLILPELEKMKGVDQPSVFHSEGDVWEHTILTLRNLKSNSDINLKIATLFHDIGKPDTQTLPKDKNDRIRFNEHDDNGAEIYAKTHDRIKLSSPFSRKNKLYINKKEVEWLIRNHMICITKNPGKMRPGTIEKYFFKNRIWGKNLLNLSEADIGATISENGQADFSNLNKLKKRIREVEKIIEKEEKAKKLANKFPQILNGNEIMQVFGLSPGPLVGKAKEFIRYLQLEGIIDDKKDVNMVKNKILESLEKTKNSEEAINYFKKIV